MGISLGALAGLPPSPLFVSELLIVAGGFEAGRSWAAGATALLLALGFLGLAHALIETTVGKARRGCRAAPQSPHAGVPRRRLGRAAPRALGRRALAAGLRARRRAAQRNLVTEHGTAAAYREAITTALSGGWRFAGLHATSDGACVRALLADARGADSTGDRARAGRQCSFDRRPRPGRGLGRTRGARPPGRHLRGPRASAASRRPRSRARPLDGAGTRPRRLPGCRRADPRRDHRVRPFPVPRRRRAHPAPRRAALLQAPRPRACGRRADARGRARVRIARVCCLRSREQRRVRPRL